MGISEKRLGSLSGYPSMEAAGEYMPGYGKEHREIPASLSVVLPAYNEEQAIVGTISDILAVLQNWIKDFEIIVV